MDKVVKGTNRSSSKTAGTRLRTKLNDSRVNQQDSDQKAVLQQQSAKNTGSIAKNPTAASSASLPEQSGAKHVRGDASLIPGKTDVSQTRQHSGAETQHKAAELQTKQGENYLKTRMAAKGLENLGSSKVPTTITPKAVLQKTNPQQSNNKPQQQQTQNLPQSNLATNHKTAVSTPVNPVNKGTAAKTGALVASKVNPPAKQVQVPSEQAQDARQATTAAGAAVATHKVSSENKPEEPRQDKKKSAKEKSASKSKASARASAAGAERGLANLQSQGNGADTSGDAYQQEYDGNSLVAVNKNDNEAERLPKEYPGLSVLSEFDSSKPGLGDVLHKALIYRNMIVKDSLSRIAQLDQELNLEISSLAKRVVGDPGLTKDLKTAKFITSVYGGTFA